MGETQKIIDQMESCRKGQDSSETEVSEDSHFQIPLSHPTFPGLPIPKFGFWKVPAVWWFGGRVTDSKWVAFSIPALLLSCFPSRTHILSWGPCPSIEVWGPCP